MTCELRRQAVLIVTDGGAIHLSDKVGRLWLREFFRGPSQSRMLPAELRRWVSRPTSDRRGCSLVVRTATGELHVSRERRSTQGKLILLFELTHLASKRLSERNLLTAREREVLFWLAHGRSNAEVGAILGIATATVGKHLEKIYPKLGVHNRTAASSFYFS
jgi:DNA-binding CsgD family transcriptional regulator